MECSLFIHNPLSHFRIHTFEWHGQDQDEADHMIRAARKITQLPMMPEHFSDKINEVRTIDDTKMVIKLVVYYELADPLKMVSYLPHYYLSISFTIS